MNKPIIAAVAALGSLVVSASANAACANADLPGTWYAFVTTHSIGPVIDTDGDGIEDEWISYPYRCKTILDSSRRVTSSSWCRLPDGVPFEVIPGTRFSVSGSCTVSATGPNGSVIGQMSRDKLTMTGLTRLSDDSEWNIFTAVKK